jgi:hypothetical protein
MQDIIDAIAKRAGISAETATLIVGTILAFIQKEAPQGVVTRILAAFPEANEIISKAQAAAPGGIGAVIGRLGSLIGGKAGDAVTLISQLLATGATMSQLETAGEVLMKGIREEAGAKAVTDLLKHVPELGKLVQSA